MHSEVTMRIWLARCLAGTIGCGGLALLAGLLSSLLSAGGDEAGGQALRITAGLLGTVAMTGVVALVVMLTALQLETTAGNVSSSQSDPPADT